MSSTFYAQLLREKVAKAQKDTDDLTVFFKHLGSSNIKAVPKMLMKLAPDQLEFVAYNQSHLKKGVRYYKGPFKRPKDPLDCLKNVNLCQFQEFQEFFFSKNLLS